MVYVNSGTTSERVHVLAMDVTRSAVTGATLVMKVWRSSDGKFLDFSDSTFKTSGHTSLTMTMTEHSASNNPGVYYGDVPIVAVANAIVGDVYSFRIDQSGGSSVVTLPALGEVRVGRWVDAIDTNLDATIGSRATNAGAALAVWGTSVPGAFGVGTAGANLDVATSTRAVAGDAMTLASNAVNAAALAADAVAEIQSGLATSTNVGAVANDVWSTALPGAYSVGTAGANLNVAISTRAVAGDAMTLATNAVNAAALASDAVTEIQSGLATSANVAAVPNAVWSTALPGAYSVGTAGANLDVATSTRAVAGDAMTLATNSVNAAALANDAVVEIQNGLATSANVSAVPNAVWGTLVPGAFGAGTAGANLDAATSTRAVAGDAMTLASNAVNAAALASDAVVEIQSGLATSAALSTLSTNVAAVPGAVWDVVTSAHVTVGTFGQFMAVRLDVATSTRAVAGDAMTLATDAVNSTSLATSAVTEIQAGLSTAANVAAVPAAVWNVSQSGYTSGATTFGWALRTLRVLATNRIAETPGTPGTMTVYADDGTTPFLTYSLTDFNGNGVLGMVGAPARRAAGVVP